MSNVGFRVFTRVERPSAALVETFKGVAVANLADCMAREFCMDARIKRMNKFPLLGTAITVKSRVADNLMVHKAMDLAQQGDVIVVDCQGDSVSSVIGELMASYAEKKGIAGIIIDGAIRDVEAMQDMKISVFAAGITPKGPYKDGPGEVNVPISCGGTVVHPGDIIVGDADGIVVLRPQDAADILEKAKALHDREEEALKQIQELAWDRSWIDKTLKEKGCEII